MVIQSMTNTQTADTAVTLAQIRALEAAGCELVRVAVPDKQAAAALPELVAQSPLPLVADIHFDYRLALTALDAGVAKLRINPGNIGGQSRLVKLWKKPEKNVALRIGVNAGSLKTPIGKIREITAEALGNQP